MLRVLACSQSLVCHRREVTQLSRSLDPEQALWSRSLGLELALCCTMLGLSEILVKSSLERKWRCVLASVMKQMCVLVTVIDCIL